MIRRLAYWGLDYLKGRPVGRQLRELEEAFKDPDAALVLSQQRVRALIDHACNTTDYYRQFRGAKELHEFPILQKRTIRERYEEFLSSAYERSSLIPVTTSGSYGTPLTFYLTQEKKARQHAEVIYFSSWLGYKIGDRHAFVRVRDKSKLKLFMQNRIKVNPAVIDAEWMEEQRQMMLREEMKVFIGYPSVLSSLAEYCKARNDSPNSFRLGAIITIAEPLGERIRATLRQVFGCPVVSRYSAAEMGVLAHECNCTSRYHLNIASYIFEVLSLDKDSPVSVGGLGRVVVTDLFSYAMPLIRYDTGDLAVLGSACPCGLPGPTLQRIDGRINEGIVRIDGRRISPFAINNTIMDLENIVQFQFVQKGARSYELRLVTFSYFNQEDLMRQRLLDILGTDAELKLSYVEQIPPLPSGKRPYIINEWRQRQLAERN
jgi:phenylacetate-CoA ligase